jgi:hypothetical protein
MNTCRRGHQLVGDNRYERPDGYVECRACRAANFSQHRADRAPLTIELVLAAAPRFRLCVKRSSKDACWTWKAAKGARGYGSFRIGYHTIGAHRVALALKLKRLPSGIACHTCDNPSCCNPSHLYDGTDATNQLDKKLRGRAASGHRHGSKTHPERIPRGERNGMAKLTDMEREKIHTLYATGRWTQQQLALRFGIRQPSVSAIIRRRR